MHLASCMWGRWEARGEYVHSHGRTTKGGANESDGWYAMAGRSVPGCQRLKVYGRWDCYRDDATTWQGLKTNWGLSANYRLGKNYLFQVNTLTRTIAPAPIGNYNTIDVQVSANSKSNKGERPQEVVPLFVCNLSIYFGFWRRVLNKM